MIEPERDRDRWAERLLHRRFGGDVDELRATLDVLVPSRDRVRANAAITPIDPPLDAGCGDGPIAFGALDPIGDAGRVVLSDAWQDLLDHPCDLAEGTGGADRRRFVRAAEDLAPMADASVDVVTTRPVSIDRSPPNPAPSPFSGCCGLAAGFLF